MPTVTATVRDGLGQEVRATAQFEVVLAPLYTRFLTWHDGQFARMRWYGDRYLVFANEGRNEAFFRQVGAAPQFWPPTHGLVIEVWAAPGGKERYKSGGLPAAVKDMLDTDGLWVVNDGLLFGTFPWDPGTPMPTYETTA